MKKAAINNNEKLTLNDCLFECRIALEKLRGFEASEAFYYMKGILRPKKEKKKVGGKVYTHDSIYYVRVDYINKERKVKETYVKDGDVESIQNKLAGKKENRKKYSQLKKTAKALFKQLDKLMIKTNTDKTVWERFEAYANKHEAYRQNDGHAANESISALGERCRSKAECILANQAFSVQLPYLYEADVDVEVNGRKKTFRPDFSFFIKGKWIILELLGMLDKDDYVVDWIQKKQVYAENGYVEGKNLVCIACKDSQGIDSRKITQVLRNLKRGFIPREMVYA